MTPTWSLEGLKRSMSLLKLCAKCPVCANGHFPATSFLDSPRASRLREFKKEIKASEQEKEEGFIRERWMR